MINLVTTVTWVVKSDKTNRITADANTFVEPDYSRQMNIDPRGSNDADNDIFADN